MGKKTPPYPAHPDWTTGRYFSFLRSNIRRMWTKWPPRYKVISRYKRDAEWNWENANGRAINVRFEYQCNSCKEWWPMSWIEVDHIHPVGSLKTHDDLPQFVERLLCPEEDLQLLCKDCHQEKTHGNNDTN